MLIRSDYWARLKARIFLRTPFRLRVSTFIKLSKRLPRELLHGPAHDARSTLFLINYRGQYIDAATGFGNHSQNSLLQHQNIIHFSSPLKSHRVIQPNATVVDRRIGAPIKLITDVLLREVIDDPRFLQHNFKQDQLRALGVGRILVHAYPSAPEPFAVARETTIGFYQDPIHYFDRSVQCFVEQALLSKFARRVALDGDGQFLRDDRGFICVTDVYSLEEICRKFRLTFTAYSFGGEFLHMMSNCLAAYLQPHFVPSQIQQVLRQVVAVSAGSNNPLPISESLRFRTWRIANYYDEHVLKKLDVKSYYPQSIPRDGGAGPIEVSPEVTLLWTKTPYQIEHYHYEGEQRQTTSLTNFQYHLERAYFHPRYFPEAAYQALITSVRCRDPI